MKCIRGGLHPNKKDGAGGHKDKTRVLLAVSSNWTIKDNVTRQ